LNKVVNTYLADNRLRTQKVATRTATIDAGKWTRTVIGTKTEVRRRGGVIPSWVFFSIILLALGALCVTATMRFQIKANAAAIQFEETTKEVETLRNANGALQDEVKRLQNDPRMIEAAARTRLNMVRENEIIVPVQ
jgi:cell division protein FtsB